MLSFKSFHAYLARHASLLRAMCATESVIGSDADGPPACFFLVTGGAAPNGTRGIIPSSGFGRAAPLRLADIEASAEAGSVEATIMGGVPHLLCQSFNRQVDESIIRAVEACDAIASLSNSGPLADMAARGKVALGNNEVPVEEINNMFGLGTPALCAEISTHPRAERVTVRYGDQEREFLRWAGLNWAFHPMLRNASREECYVFHRYALGHALDFAALTVTGGVDPKTGLGWMKAKTRQLATVLQPAGIVRVINDATKYMSKAA